MKTALSPNPGLHRSLTRQLTAQSENRIKQKMTTRQRHLAKSSGVSDAEHSMSSTTSSITFFDDNIYYVTSKKSKMT